MLQNGRRNRGSNRGNFDSIPAGDNILNVSLSTIAIAGVVLFLAACPAHAEGKSKEELAKAAQNPIANMISVPLQNNINTGIGPDDETQNILNIQPVYPISLEFISSIRQPSTHLPWHWNFRGSAQTMQEM